MRFGKWVIALFTAVLILVAVIFGTNQYSWDGSVGISARISSPEGTEDVYCTRRDGMYYLFLPSYADLEQVTLYSNTITGVLLDGKPLNGMTGEDWELNRPYTLCYQAKARDYEYPLTIVQSGKVPTLYVDTASGTLERIHETKGNQEAGHLRLYTAGGELDHSGDLEAIKGRGNSTWQEEKKPYNLTLSISGDLLGMGSAKRWVLLANALDPSHLRNKIVYDFASRTELGYAPETAWVDLYLNGEYAGLYLLCERNEVHEQRLNIGTENSFLVSKDWAWRLRDNGQPYFETEGKAALRIHHSSVPEDMLYSLWQSAENAILAESGIDPVTGKHWQELIDVDSWARKILIEEIFANTDGASLSQYFYYDAAQSEKIFAGPVWDYDLTLGTGKHPVVSELFACRPGVYGSYWYQGLCEKAAFWRRMVELYEEEMLPLLTGLLEEQIPAWQAEIAEAAAVNQLRWSSKDPQEAAAMAVNYLSQRIQFLNSLWLEGEDYVYVLVDAAEYGNYFYALRPGQMLPSLPEYADTETTHYHGWMDMETRERVEEEYPVYRDTWLLLTSSEKTPEN